MRPSILAIFFVVGLSAAACSGAATGPANARPVNEDGLSPPTRAFLKDALEQNGGVTGWCRNVKSHGKDWAQSEVKRLAPELVRAGDIIPIDTLTINPELKIFHKNNCAAEFMTEAQVRSKLVGNTITFRNAVSGKTILIYFNADGHTEIETKADPKRVFTKKWFFNEKGVLCRTIGKDNHTVCTPIAAGKKPDTLRFEIVKKSKSFQVTVLAGRQLDK